MGKAFKPSSPFDVAMKLLTPTETMVKGVVKKVFPDPSGLRLSLDGNELLYAVRDQTGHASP